MVELLNQFCKTIYGVEKSSSDKRFTLFFSLPWWVRIKAREKEL
jgi:hypothetical protein